MLWMTNTLWEMLQLETQMQVEEMINSRDLMMKNSTSKSRDNNSNQMSIELRRKDYED